jgi:hypothetical protein
MADSPSGARMVPQQSESPKLDLVAMGRKAGLTRVPRQTQSPRLDLAAQARKLGITRFEASQSPRLTHLAP